MFGRKKWKVDLNLEGELQAATAARKEGWDQVNPDFDQYPVNVQLPKKMTLKQAVRKVIDYSQAGIYAIMYRIKS